MEGIIAIDQSLKHTAFCHMVKGRSELLECMDTTDMTHFNRIDTVLERLGKILDECNPEGVVMEDYAFSTVGRGASNNLTKLGELGGCCKMLIRGRGFQMGIETVLRNQPWFLIQTQSEMKKFCLDSGNVKKDSRYLLEVFKRMKVDFEDDNQADAYMHAWRASAVVAVIRGKTSIENFSKAQQLSLMGRGIKKKSGLTETKALKLPEDDKLKLVIL